MTYTSSRIPSFRTYAGIGSRRTPDGILSLMDKIGELLAGYRLTLRSGGAPGADMAFERGCDRADGKKEIFLPWRGFNGSTSPLFTPSAAAETLASRCHPTWRACSLRDRKFHARNCQQVLGRELNDPVNFVLFWAREVNGVVSGGTATAVFLARKNGIPTFNLREMRMRENWIAFADGCEQTQQRFLESIFSWINSEITIERPSD